MKLLEVNITEIMTKNVVCVLPTQKLVDVKHIFEKQKFHHHIPVTSGEELVGIISLTDFLFGIKNASLDDNDSVYQQGFVKDIMIEHPVTIKPTATIKQAAEVLAEGNIHALIVADNKIVKGIVSTADVIKYFLKMNS
jgi:CBS domain-containing protein